MLLDMFVRHNALVEKKVIFYKREKEFIVAAFTFMFNGSKTLDEGYETSIANEFHEDWSEPISIDNTYSKL